MRYSAVGLVSAILLLALAVSSNADYQPTTIYQIQQGAFSIGDSVSVDSVVVTAVDTKPDTYGFHAQERPGGPWSGILCYMSAVFPTVQVGDMVQVFGYYDEYFGHSEIQVHSVSLIKAGYGAPACTLLSCGDLGMAPSDSFAEQWEGVFLCVDTVVVIFHDAYAEWVVEEYHTHPGSGQGDSLRIDDKLIDPTLTPPDIGDTLALIKGVYAEEWDNYRLWVRSTDDLVFMGPTPGPHLVHAYATTDTSIHAIFDRTLKEASAENPLNYLLEQSGTAIDSIDLQIDKKTVKLITATQPAGQLDSLVACNVESEGGYPMERCEKYGFIGGITPINVVQTPAHAGTDSSQMEGEQVTITGVVTSPDTSFGGPFFMEDAVAPWHGIYIYYPAGDFDEGDSIIISGVVDEYYGLTELISIDYFQLLGKGSAVIPDVVLPGLLTGDPVTSEPYEGLLVSMDSVDVFTFLDIRDEWKVGKGTDTVHVGDFACVPPGPCYDYPGLGSIITITGPFRYWYEYKIEPRNNADIVVHYAVPASTPEDKTFPLALHQNAPNPFLSGTSIRFSVPKKMKIRLAIYDVYGRLVKVATEEVAEPGEYHVTWDGRDSFGSGVSPGIYFYRLITPEKSMTKKMVFVK